MNFCSICQMPFEGFGANAEPINGGRCCERCDNFVVIPARLQIAMRKLRARAPKMPQRDDWIDEGDELD